MSDRVRARLILERWHSGISRDDRKHDKLSGLFSTLFEDMFHAGVEFDVAYDYVRESAKMLYPAAGVVKKTYAGGIAKRFSTVEEFAKNWHDSIDKASMEAFYQFYEIEGLNKNTDRKKPASKGPQSDDELNEQDFWSSVKSVSKENPWLFDDKDE